MRPFGRRTASGPEAFWSWWAQEGRTSTTAAAARGAAADTVEVLGRAVSALDPGLAWEVGPGELCEHVLVVTAAGDPALRAVARRWLLAAPAGDQSWSFTDHRPPAPDPESVTLTFEGQPDIDLARITVTARAAGSHFDVTVHHPVFADLEEKTRAQLAFLALDTALGENDVELWLGEITATGFSLVDGFGLPGLRAVVDDLRSRRVDADGGPTWVMLSGDGPDGAVIAMAQAPLHPLTAPDLALHAVVLLPYAAANDEGLPLDASLEALRSLEDALSTELGRTGRVVAHESSAGVRMLHLYLDDTTDAISVVRRHAGRWSEGRARVESTPDPAWDGVRHLRA